MKRFFTICFGFFVIVGSAIADQNTSEFVLDNGLKLIVKEDSRAPVVVSQVWYKVGSSYEPSGLTGISHALEHMMFKGTDLYPNGEFSRIISENGGRDNAFTGTDYTAYFQTMEKSRLEISFELEADRMRNLILDAEEFAKEIEVVKEERRWRTEDKPASYLYEVAKATAFQTSPYQNPIVGWMSDLDSMKIDDLKTWYQKWYAPNNATVVVVGDVDTEQVLALAKQYFEPLSPEKIIPPKKIPEVKQVGIKRVNVKRPAELPSLLLMYKTPVLKTAMEQNQADAENEIYALEVLAGILDGGNSARFASNLVRGKEVAASVGAYYGMASRLDNVFTISATPSQGNSVATMEQAIKQEIEMLKTEPVSATELDRVKAQVVSSEVYEKDSVFGQAMVLGILETVGLDWQMADDYVEKIQAVTPDDIMAVANKYFHDDVLTVATLDPLPIEPNAGTAPPRGLRHAY